MSPQLWLKHLNRDEFESLPRQWQRLVISYGLAITHLQRARRLNNLSSKPTELAEEYCHRGHANWDPEEYPETLLLETESGILVREEQEIIAAQMRQPTNDKNAVVQLIMGGGKQSTLLPIVAANLADECKYVSIVIPKFWSHLLISQSLGWSGLLLESHKASKCWTH